MNWKYHVVVVSAMSIVLGGGLSAWSQEKGKKPQESGDQERQVKEGDVPAAALAALKKLAGSTKITEFAEEIENGHKFYEGSWKGADGNIDGLVTEAGDVVEIEESVPMTSVPASVREAAAKEAGEGAKLTFEKKTVYMFEIHFKKDGKSAEMIFTPDGGRFVEASEEKGEDDDDDK